MSTVNYTNYNNDLTVRVFDSFYNYDANIPADEYDIVYSYFRSVMSTARIAGNFTVSLFRIAEETNIPALTLLDAMKGQTGLNLTASLAYYLNSIRSRATLLGINASTVPNQYAARLVLQ
jgi:pyruvate/2-oxoacid:ferredoxin oxidoreductase alpha subunit